MSTTYYKIRHLRANGNHDKPYYAYTGYVEPYGEVWFNLHGGWCLKEGTEILETISFEGTKEQFIAYYRTEFYSYLIDKNSPYGWLSPSCKWYPCDYTKHQELAENYLGLDEQMLEEKGWIKVFKEMNSDKPTYSSRPNNQQLEWLLKRDIRYSKYAYYQ